MVLVLQMCNNLVIVTLGAFASLKSSKTFIRGLENCDYCPDQCGSVGWASSCKLKGHWFDSRSLAGACVRTTN